MLYEEEMYVIFDILMQYARISSLLASSIKSSEEPGDLKFSRIFRCGTEQLFALSFNSFRSKMDSIHSPNSKLKMS